MNWFIFFIVYLILVLVLSTEGQKRQIGGWQSFIISVFFTPVIGSLAVFLSKKKVSFHHFVKRNDDRKNEDQWIELKT